MTSPQNPNEHTSQFHSMMHCVEFFERYRSQGLEKNSTQESGILN